MDRNCTSIYILFSATALSLFQLVFGQKSATFGHEGVTVCAEVATEKKFGFFCFF